MSYFKSIQIYQLKREYMYRMFGMSYAFLRERNYPINKSAYNLVWEGPAPSPRVGLEEIYTMFNINHPADFKGHSLSMSDVVVLIRDCGVTEAHIVDQIGFARVHDFLEDAPAIKVDTDTKGFRARGYKGTWRVISLMQAYEKTYFVMEEEHEPVYGLFIIVDEAGTVVTAMAEREISSEMRAALYQHALFVPSLPDKTITETELQDYGYKMPGMLPLTAKAAPFCRCPELYCLFEDGTAKRVADRKEIDAHAKKDGMFGVWKGDWLAYLREVYIESALESAVSYLNEHGRSGLSYGVMDTLRNSEEFRKFAGLRIANATFPEEQDKSVYADLMWNAYQDWAF